MGLYLLTGKGLVSVGYGPVRSNRGGVITEKSITQLKVSIVGTERTGFPGKSILGLFLIICAYFISAITLHV